MSIVKQKVEGISGDTQICTIFPYEILEIVEEPDPISTPDLPIAGNPNQFIGDIIRAVIDLLKKLLNLL